MDYVTDQIIKNIIEVVKKKEKKGGVTIKPFQVSEEIHKLISTR